MCAETGDRLLDQVRAGLEQGWVGAGAGDYEVDAVVQAVPGEVGADGPVGVVADDSDRPAGVAAAGDDLMDVWRRPGGGHGGKFQIGHLSLNPCGEVGADGRRVGEDLDRVR